MTGSLHPDMQELVDRFGAFHLVPPDEWEKFRAAKHAWWSDYIATIKNEVQHLLNNTKR